MSAHMTRGGLVAAIGILIAITAVHTLPAQDVSTLDTEALTAKGAWSPTVTYRRDDVVTARGSTWRAKKLNKGKVPGQTAPSTAAFWELLAAGFNPKGAWVSTKKYQPNDLVTSNGSTWRAKRTNVNKAPVAGPNWEQFAAKGAAGPNTGVSAGTQSVPAISFDNDADTGIFSPADGKIALVENGTLLLHSNGTANTAVGSNALATTTPGERNTAVGTMTLSNLDGDADDNTAVGTGALGNNSNGDANTAIGSAALANNVSGSLNTAVGLQALQNNTLSANTAVGALALLLNGSGSDNTAVGTQSMLFNSTGTQNTAVGRSALFSSTITHRSTAIGYNALNGATGAENTAVGANAMSVTTTGSDNVALGAGALGANTSGSNNIAIGHDAGSALADANKDNNIFIGNIGHSANSATIKIGTDGTHTATFIAGIKDRDAMVAGVQVYIDEVTGQLSGPPPSSARYKEDIQPVGDLTGMLTKLRPVTFRYKEPAKNGSKPIQYGLIAEEVAEVMPYLAVFKPDGTLRTVHYERLPTFLLAGWQAQQRTIDAQAKEIAEQDDEIDALEARLRRLEALLAGVKEAAIR